VFGHSRQDALGRSLDLIIPERLRQRHWEGFANVMRSGESRYGEGDLLSVPALRNVARRSLCSSRSPRCGKPGRWSVWPRSSAT
jgi:hypothetical protein